jgi:hypothetical protein
LENRECRRLITGPCHPNFQLRSLCDKAVAAYEQVYATILDLEEKKYASA